jgi:hypothetical protein
MANIARSKPESWADVLWLMMASFAMVLLIYVAACSAIIEFAYRHLVAAPIEWLMARLVHGLREGKINCDLPAVWPAGPDRRRGLRGPSQKS